MTEGDNMELEQKLLETQQSLQTFLTKAAEEKQQQGAVLQETKNAIDALGARINELDERLAYRQSNGGPTLEEQLKANEDLQRWVSHFKKNGTSHGGTVRIDIEGAAARELIEGKTTIDSTAVGFPTHGVMPTERGPLVTEARRRLRVRSALTSRPTTMGEVFWPKVNAAMGNASPQVESSDKYENALTFTTASERIRTIATWIPASNQVLDDWSELAGVIRNSLMHYVDQEEDEQLLSGDATGVNLNGLTTQATSFSTALLPPAAAGWTQIDIIGCAAQQIDEANEEPATWVMMNSRDYWKTRRVKDSDGKYILGDPNSPNLPSIWGLTAIPVNSMTAGYFLVGNGSPVSAEIRDRMGLTVAISTEHSDYFVKNLVAIRAEKRLALCVYRPAAFIYGALTTSPTS